MMIDEAIDFVSNDFLGFSRLKQLQEAVSIQYQEVTRLFPRAMQGATGSRRVVGEHPFLSVLEDKIAKYHGFESAFIAHCGYMANLSLCYLVSDPKDVMLWDAGVHVSVREGRACISGKHESFLHNDVEDLERLLIKYRCQNVHRIFIFISSSYSSDGSLAPLRDIVALSKKYQALLILDEAHAFGIYGSEGKGFGSEEYREDVYAVLVTYGKAFGGFGAAILSSNAVRKEIMQKGIPVMFSTALPLHALVVIDRSYEYFKEAGHQLREKIFQLRDYYASFIPECSPGGVQSITFADQQDVVNWVQALSERNIHVGIFKAGLLRINLHAFNSFEDIDMLFTAFQTFLEEGRCRIDIDHKLYFPRKLSIK